VNITHLVVGTDAPCKGSVTSQLEPVHNVSNTVAEAYFRHLRVVTAVGNDGPLRGQRVTADRRSGLTSRVCIGGQGVAGVGNGPVTTGGLEVPLSDCESRKLTMVGDVQSGL